ncbi:MAG: carbohydrate ABC transporter permease [Ardenticatenaceae bacterium]|nr:carbohydrate ABC transporter permease [Ardenticatenaceae bacterium]
MALAPPRSLRRVLMYLFVIVMAVLMMAPVVTVILGSIRTTGQFLSNPIGLPQTGIQWENYTSILTNEDFWRSLRNSLIITITTTVLVVLIASPLAFIFSRVKFRGRNIFFNILSIGLLFPLVVAILPVFLQVRNLELINSFWGVILPLTTFTIPGSTVILIGFFRAIPTELEDASYIDGCTTFGFFRYILFPLARPSVAAIATLAIVAAWNEYFLSLVVLGDASKWPLTLGIMQFQGQFGTDWARVMAYVTLLIIPAILFYLVAEKYIVTGLTGGELKG